ncbi:MAG: membrane protein insertion efficiency factor YidD [Planctomycetota bacterium]|nr:membrane protein insertion efficiency factor YidD [Planctomycetota bacterium]
MRLLYRAFKPFRLLWSFPIFIYQVTLSPIFGRQCIYKPSCSRYGMLAVLRHGILRGTLLTVWRVLRCNPFSVGGDDPVPD